MKKLLLKKILQFIIILFGVSFLSFNLMQIAPGDPAQILLRENGTPPTKELLEVTRHKMGLDKDILTQYGNWVKKAAKFDFGKSYANNLDACDQFTKYLPETINLSLLSFLLCTLISIPLGFVSALYKNKFIDIVIRFFSVFSLSCPNFLIGLVLMYIFSIKLKLLPVLGSGEIKHIILPAFVLAISLSGKVINQVRASVIDELNKDYVVGLQALGLPKKIVLREVLHNSMIGILTILGMTLGAALGGTPVIEILFNYKGISSQVVTSISNRDYPMIQLYTLWMGLVFLIINFIVDILYLYVNPSLRKGHNYEKI